MYNKVAIVGAVAVFGGLTAGDDSYGSPLAPAYGAPAASYNEPATQNYAGYGGLQPSYNPPAPAYKPAAKPLIKPPVYAGVAELDLTPVIIGILVLTGLSLLFPTYVSLSSDATRRRRSADGSQDESSGNSVVERVQDIYMSVLESEECMERVACEVGGLAADAGLSPKMLSMATPFVPQKYSKMMKTFSTGKDCHKIKCGKIF